MMDLFGTTPWSCTITTVPRTALRFFGSVQQDFKEVAEPDRFRSDQCPQCEAHPCHSRNTRQSITTTNAAVEFRPETIHSNSDASRSAKHLMIKWLLQK
jgi:hypothetical protein